MKRNGKVKLVLFANQVEVDQGPLVRSEQGQVFFATDRETKKKVVVKQIPIESNSYALIKELEVFQLALKNAQAESA